MKILVPTSLGELYDKISILEIKSASILGDKEKLSNINNELAELRKISRNYNISDLYYNSLKSKRN